MSEWVRPVIASDGTGRGTRLVLPDGQNLPVVSLKWELTHDMHEPMIDVRMYGIRPMTLPGVLRAVTVLCGHCGHETETIQLVEHPAQP